MIKTILAPVLGDLTDVPVYGTAVATARFLRAHLQFLFMGPKTSELLGVSEGGDFAAGLTRPEILFDLERAEEAGATDARLAFKRFCERERIAVHDAPPGPHATFAEWRHEQGDRISSSWRRRACLIASAGPSSSLGRRRPRPRARLQAQCHSLPKRTGSSCSA